MTLGSDIASKLPGLRVEAESRFTETFDFFTAVESSGSDLDTVTAETTVAADVPGRVKFPAVQPRDGEAGGQVSVTGGVEVHVAVGSHASRNGEYARVTASTADAGLVGRVFTILRGPVMGQVTAWRHPAQEA